MSARTIEGQVEVVLKRTISALFLLFGDVLCILGAVTFVVFPLLPQTRVPVTTPSAEVIFELCRWRERELQERYNNRERFSSLEKVTVARMSQNTALIVAELHSGLLKL